MTDYNQNFSVLKGDDIAVDYDIGPDTTGLDLSTASVTWTGYFQAMGMPDRTDVLLTKDKSSGITITDPTALLFTVAFTHDDTLGQNNGNIYYEITIVDVDGTRTTPTIGLMTVIDPAAPVNVASFKTMFPELATTDDTIVQLVLDAADGYVGEWGDDAAIATYYLAAHFSVMASAAAGTEGQIVSSETIGRISVSYASASVGGQVATDGAAAMLGRSPYGRYFWALLRVNGIGIMVV